MGTIIVVSEYYPKLVAGPNQNCHQQGEFSSYIPIQHTYWNEIFRLKTGKYSVITRQHYLGQRKVAGRVAFNVMFYVVGTHENGRNVASRLKPLTKSSQTARTNKIVNLINKTTPTAFHSRVPFVYKSKVVQ